MATMEPRWDDKNQRWECSLGSGKSRTWFRCRVKGEEGRTLCAEKKRLALEGPKPLIPGSLAEFIEAVWWPRVNAKSRPSTIRGYRYIVANRLKPFYSRQIADLRLEVLQPWVLSLDLSPKRVQNIYATMAAILELAHKTGRYPLMDHRLVVLPEIPKTRKPEFEPGTLAKLLDAAKGTELEGPIFAAGLLGLRLGEVCGLKVPHVLPECVDVQDNRQGSSDVSKLKSRRAGDSKRINVPRHVSERLLSYAKPGSLYLFTWNGKPIPADRISRYFPAVCKKAGLPRMRFHDLRHLAESELEKAGASQIVKMQILGHSTIKSSLRYEAEARSAQMDAIDKVLGVTRQGGEGVTHGK